MLIAQADVVFLIAAAMVFLVAAVMVLALFVTTFAPWLQSYMAGAPLSMLEILGMRFRRVDVKVVVRSLIMARQAGAALSREEVERAYLQGVDLDKVTLAYIKATKENMGLSFQNLVDADLNDQLAEKLGR